MNRMPALLQYAMAALCLCAVSAYAQEVDHSKMDHSKMGHAMPETKQEPAIDHSKMDHSKMGHDMPEAKQEPTVDHSKMDHSKMDHAEMVQDTEKPIQQPLTPIPAVSDLDRLAAFPIVDEHAMHGENSVFGMLLFERLEAWDASPGTGLAWDAQAWVGTDINRLWVRSEGEQVAGELESAGLELLYGRSVAPWWDVVAGLRHDFKPGQSQDFLAVGVIGMTPYKFELEATAYIGQSGRSAARFALEYETLLSNRLIAQPVIEAEFNGRSDATRSIGSGLSTAEAGLRLRYEFSRRFAPYIGVSWEKAYGQTAQYRLQEGEDTQEMRVVAGLRMWF
jgi:copper resistance protein B